MTRCTVRYATEAIKLFSYLQNYDLDTLAQDLYDWNWTCWIRKICYINTVIINVAGTSLRDPIRKEECALHTAAKTDQPHARRPDIWAEAESNI